VPGPLIVLAAITLSKVTRQRRYENENEPGGQDKGNDGRPGIPRYKRPRAYPEDIAEVVYVPRIAEQPTCVEATSVFCAFLERLTLQLRPRIEVAANHKQAHPEDINRAE